MARYLSPEWVQSFDAALGALNLHDAIAAAGSGSLAAADGTFSVIQVVTGAPDGGADRHLVLDVAGGRAHLYLDLEGTASGSATIVLCYADALALAHGRLDPADALAEGRIRVRGDLAALVAAQDVLAAAADRLGPVLAELTDPPDLP
jgi:SCP-2 sterol transfer family